MTKRSAPAPSFPGDVDLAGRAAVVTGASRGIGREIAVFLAAQGMHVLATARDTDRLLALQEVCADAAGTVNVFACDLAVSDGIDALFEFARELFPRLYLLVNNAGVGIFGPADEVSMAAWDQVMAVNARGAFRCAQHAFSWMKQGGGGRIVNIASVVGLRGYVEQATYTASKHAMLGFTKVMAREGRPHGIRVAAVCPGGVATELVRAARPDLDPDALIQPADVVRAVHFLATEPLSCCTDMISLRRAGSTPFP